MNKRVVLLSFALALIFSGRAIASENKYGWTGSYAGVHLGYGFSYVGETAHLAGSTLTANQSGSGVLGGGQAGYNWQKDMVVLGIEGSITGTDIYGRTTCPEPTLKCQHNINWIASLQPRIGVAINVIQTLLYVSGGPAWGDINYHENDKATGALFGTGSSKLQNGWGIGGGVEHFLTPNITARLSYSRYQFNGVTTVANTLSFNAVNIDPSVQVVELGVNYKF